MKERPEHNSLLYKIAVDGIAIGTTLSAFWIMANIFPGFIESLEGKSDIEVITRSFSFAVAMSPILYLVGGIVYMISDEL